jgi:hypothetical protein
MTFSEVLRHGVLVRTNVAYSSHSLVTLMMDVLCSSETPILTRGTRRNILEEGTFTVDIIATYIGKISAELLYSLLILWFIIFLF